MRTAAAALAYAAALALGLYQTFSPTFDSRFTRVQTERGDGMLNHFILEHSWQCVSNPDYRGSLSSPPCFFPQEHTLWYSEHLLGAAPAYWALRLVAAYDLAYQWWQVILAGLNFVAFAFAARRLGCPHVLALLGGYLWAFGLVHVDQVKHQQMIPRFWMPLGAYCAWSFALAPAVRWLNRTIAFTFLQSISCVYTGWFLATGVAVFLPLALVLRRGGLRDSWRLLRGHWPRLILVLVGWAAAFAAAFAPYVVVNVDNNRTYEDCHNLMPTPSAWITGPPGTRWDETLGPRAAARDQPPPGFRHWVSDECYLFCGFGVYALALAAAVHLSARLVLAVLRRRRTGPPEFAAVAAALVTAGVWVVLTLTPENEGRSLWEWVRYVPGGTAIRCVSRVYVTVYLFGTLAALLWLARVSEPLRPPARWALLGLVAAGLIYEQTGYEPPSFEKADFYEIVDRAAGRVSGADALYVRPAFTDTKGLTSVHVYGEVFAMWVGLRANVPVVNGYSGRAPPGDYPWGSDVSDERLAKWLAGRFRGRLVILTPDDPAPPRVLVVE
jgi:hypothetical protein